MLKIDLHLHTVKSSDSNVTIQDYVDMAKKRGVKVIGITDHGPRDDIFGVDAQDYLNYLGSIPRVIDGVRILKSVEANVLTKGLDIDDEFIKNLDYVLAGIHPQVAEYDLSDVGKNTEALIYAIESDKVNILSHPYINFGPVDIEAVAKAACDNNVLLEIDVKYLAPDRFKDVFLDRLKQMIQVAKLNGKKVIVNSDSHDVKSLGDDSILEKYKEQIGLTDDLIINNYPEELEKILGVEF